jgi:7,8-dihydro-6-hydroxymethylpterin-pyrophosphokinase
LFSASAPTGDREEHFVEPWLHCSRQITSGEAHHCTLPNPRDITDQPWFINTVFIVETQWEPLELLANAPK